MANILSIHFLIQTTILSVLGVFLADGAHAATLSGDLKDKSGAPVIDAVITAFPNQAALPAHIKSQQPKPLDQVNREFVSHVLPIQTGESVIFPNNDKTQHHVYSFSPGNRFEIKLYSGVPSQPITFNTPGVVALGCNIHDWMVGYIFVTDTPYFSKTDNKGHWSLALPEGEYKLSIWHEDLDDTEAASGKTVQVSTKSNNLNDTINLKRTHRSGKPPSSLQEQGYQSEP